MHADSPLNWTLNAVQCLTLEVGCLLQCSAVQCSAVLAALCPAAG